MSRRSVVGDGTRATSSWWWSSGWLPEGPADAMVGYVRTMYLPRSLRGKLELRWEREMP